ncbi:MAG: IS200/IS605 family accessory protein TnpB-related protein [Alkalibacterium sp.]|nr:IS200/IS605 family accessory protein TnpB-related protein [Alkalibacterium sp.]
MVQDFDVIVLEDLRTANMMKNHHLARSIAAQSWREIRRMLEYKCVKYGKEVIIVNPYKTSAGLFILWARRWQTWSGYQRLDVSSLSCLSQP